MLSLYRPGRGVLHRMPAGPKMLLLAVAAVGLASLPTAGWVAGVCAGAVVLAYVVSGVGARELGRQTWALRWIVAITAIGPRLTNSPAHKRAVEWSAQQMKAMGLSEVHTEPFQFGRGWTLNKVTIEMVEPRSQRSTSRGSM